MNALREVAAKTCEHGQFGKEGKVVLTLKFVPAKEGEQVIISSKVYKEVPTSTGHKKQDYNHETPFFLDKNMELCAYVPEENPGGQLNIVDK